MRGRNRLAFVGQPYKLVVDDARLRGHLITLRDKAIEDGLPSRIYDHLRHTGATEAEESGVETDKIRHLTAHASSDMNRETYIRESAKITEEIQRKRGLI